MWVSSAGLHLVRKIISYPSSVDRDSSVGIATRYRLDGPGIESRWSEDFHTRPDGPWAPPSLLRSGYRVFSGCEEAGAWP